MKTFRHKPSADDYNRLTNLFCFLMRIKRNFSASSPLRSRLFLPHFPSWISGCPERWRAVPGMAGVGLVCLCLLAAVFNVGIAFGASGATGAVASMVSASDALWQDARAALA